MGWTSTADPLENVGRSSLLFHTKEEAVAFCRKHGWEAQVRLVFGGGGGAGNEVEVVFGSCTVVCWVYGGVGGDCG